MQIELKNVSYNARLSKETYCFSATIYVDGKKAGEASNRGRGGLTMITPYALQEKLNAYGKTLPTINAYGTELGQDAELLISNLMADHLRLRHRRKA